MAQQGLNMQKGYTLIEISIVVIVIALITTSIFVGKDLLFTAKIRKDIASITEYKSAINTFELKYNGLPGDIKDAAEIFDLCRIYPAAMLEGVNSNGEFASDLGIPGNRIAGLETNDKISFFTNSFGDFSCNGDGDGIWRPTEAFYEPFNVFFLLEQAGLVKGSYSPFANYSPKLASTDQLITPYYLENYNFLFNGLNQSNVFVFSSLSVFDTLDLLSQILNPPSVEPRESAE
jgi:prepilin-type N-terminal cleavage/methylation domain-containing protein